ncbi:MAG: iron ABC transporter permease [Myxococcaceae bacterium]|nr:iron ABC transporter permease [Myxococcaceae bacterium]
MKRTPLSLRLLTLLTFVAMAVFVVFPLFTVLSTSVKDGQGGFTLEHFRALGRWQHVRPVLNSLLLAVLVAPLGTAVGLAFAFAVSRTALRGRAALGKLAQLSVIAPPFVIALSAVLLFGRNGVVTKGVLLDRLGLDLYALGFDIYGLGGLVLVETLSYFPTAFLILTGVLAAVDPAIEQAAMSLGAGRRQTFFKVTLPLAAPGLFASMLLIFIESLADFGNPLILGGRFNVLSVQAYLEITGNDDAAGGSLLAMVLLVPSVALYLLQSALLSRKGFVTVSGKPARAAPFALGPGGSRVVGGIAWGGAAAVLLFYGLVVYGSLVKLWGADSSLTVEHYARALKVSWADIRDSVVLAAISTPLTAVLGVVAAYLIERTQVFGRRALEVLSILNFAVPGTVVGIGYALAFSRPPLVLTGTAALVVALFSFRNMPVGMKAVSAALKQVDPSLEEAAQNLGASPARVLGRVTLPLVAPAVFSSLAFAFVRAMTAVSAVVFVVSGSWNLLTVAILAMVESSDLSQAAALSVVLVVLVLGAFEGMQALVRRLFPSSRPQLS